MNYAMDFELTQLCPVKLDAYSRMWRALSWPVISESGFFIDDEKTSQQLYTLEKEREGGGENVLMTKIGLSKYRNNKKDARER